MSRSRLIDCLWRAGEFSGRGFVGMLGELIAVVSEGEVATGLPGVWMAAEVVVDGERRRGTVVIGADTPVPDGAVLRVVEGCAPSVLGVDDRFVTQISFEIPTGVAECYDRLLAGAGSCACAEKIAGMDTLRRTSLYTSLLVERLRRKSARVVRIFEESRHDWNQTFHVLLFQAMGGDRNREPFAALARKATAAIVSREKSSSTRVEALLLGVAGFLFADDPDCGAKDDYTMRLEEEARHLFAKYSITPLRRSAWNLSKLYPANHPAVRLAELAALVCKRDFMLSGVLECRTTDDIESLFAVAAGEYWRTHYTPGGAVTTPADKTIGRGKARLVGINLVAPLMFAYGKATDNNVLCERALDLLTTIPPEKNRLLDRWYAGGCKAENGFDSQALIELTKEYCAVSACSDCRVGRAAIKSALGGA